MNTDEIATPVKPVLPKSFSKSAPTSPLANSKGVQSRKKTRGRRSESITNEYETVTDEEDDDDDRNMKLVDEHGQYVKGQAQIDKGSSSSIEKGKYVRIVLGDGRGEIGRVQYISSENGYLYIDIENGNQYLKHLNEVVLLTKAEAKKALRSRNADKYNDTKKGKKQSLTAKKRGKRSRSPSPSTKSTKQSRVVPAKISKSPRSTKSSPKSVSSPHAIKSTPKSGKKAKHNEEHLKSAASLLMDLLTVPDSEGNTDAAAESQMTDNDTQNQESMEMLKEEGTQPMVSADSGVQLL
jgi:hypothetical protein